MPNVLNSPRTALIFSLILFFSWQSAAQKAGLEVNRTSAMDRALPVLNVAAAAEQAGHAREHAELVLHQNRNCVSHKLKIPRPLGTAGGFRARSPGRRSENDDYENIGQKIHRARKLGKGSERVNRFFLPSRLQQRLVRAPPQCTPVMS